jgi:ribosomal protein S16
MKINKLRISVFLILILLLILVLFFQFINSNKINSKIDYSNSTYWLSLPADNSKEVDIFYVYPTAWYKKNKSEPNFCAIDNPIMAMGAQSAFERQATAFETVGNVYAPFYRQADAQYTLSLPENERWNVIGEIPAKDVTAAFDYYIKNHNNNRPFIFVGHSQGSNVLLFLLADYMKENPEIYKQMIGAYVIGYPVTMEFMNENKHLKFAESANDTGVIISYNTQSPSVTLGSNVVVANNVGLVINPINWKRDETLATPSENLGAYMPDSSGNYTKVNNFADAQIDLKQGVLISSNVNEDLMFKLSSSMGLGIYHSFDIPFYYYNLRENAKTRADTYLAK